MGCCVPCELEPDLLRLFPRDDSEGRRVKRICAFWDEHYGKYRSITDVDWSPKARSFTLSRPIGRLILETTVPRTCLCIL